MVKKVLLIALLVVFILKVNAQTNPCAANVAASKYPEDTTIILPSGTMLIFNRCEYYDIRNCISIKELTTPQDLQAAGLNMIDESGIPLLTCGMLKIDLSGCGKTCFEVPITVKIKIRFSDCNKNKNAIPQLYVGGNGSWATQPNDTYKKEKINNEDYMVVKANCSIAVNCDVPKRLKQKVKFKTHRAFSIDSMRIGINCPLYYYDVRNKRSSNKLKLALLCSDPSKVQVEAILHNKKQNIKKETVTTNLLGYRHGRRKLFCETEKRKFLGLFTYIKQNRKSPFVYRKYKLKLQ